MTSILKGIFAFHFFRANPFYPEETGGVQCLLPPPVSL
jgi:hypothetical protein